MSSLYLDITIIPAYHAGTLAIADVSSYPPGTGPQNPFLEVTPPGFPKQALSFVPRQINIYNSTSLRLSPEGVHPLALPDGIWKLRYSVTPNYERFIEKTVLRLDQLIELFDAAFLKIDLAGCESGMKDKLKKQLDTIELYMQAAMAAAGKCNEKLATDYYRKAKKMLEIMNCDC